jgi:DNA repair exonuclease SbcCD ATPase subunit
MTLKTQEELVVGGPSRGEDASRSLDRSEMAIDGGGTPLDGAMAQSIDGGASPSLAGPDATLRLDGGSNHDSNHESQPTHERIETGVSLPANSNRRPSSRESLNGGERLNRERSERSDPEKVRLVAEINAVWKRLEAVEDKRLRLREEVDELRLSLSEEQRARSTATRELRQAEERAARALRDLEEMTETCEALRSELESAKQRLIVQRWEFLAKGAAAASGVLGVAAILTRSLVGRAGSVLSRLPALTG